MQDSDAFLSSGLRAEVVYDKNKERPAGHRVPSSSQKRLKQVPQKLIV